MSAMSLLHIQKRLIERKLHFYFTPMDCERTAKLEFERTGIPHAALALKQLSNKKFAVAICHYGSPATIMDVEPQRLNCNALRVDYIENLGG